ncbi:MAG TPA: ATP-binding protein, partial [Pedococcus sp.]
MTGEPLPDPALVVLVGASGSGKSTWANARYRSAEVVSSDHLRGVLGSGPADLDASADAFAVLDLVVAARVRRGLTVVVDTLGLDAARRAGWLALARASGLPAVAVVLEADPATCRRRNAGRDRPVPARVLDTQLRQAATVADELAAEGWDHVVRVDTSAPATDPAPGPRPVVAPPSTPRRLPLVLQL